MGYDADARCLDYGLAFTVSCGGGFTFHLVRCNKCGATKSIGFDELGDLHMRHLRGQPGPHCVATSDHDERVRSAPSIEPISEKEYRKGISTMAGKCRCGGKFTLGARPRCPKCRSTRIEEGETTAMYD